MVTLDNGVSPLLPILFLAGLSGLWLCCQLIRLYYADRFWEGKDPLMTKKPDSLYPDGAATEPIDRILLYRERIKTLTSMCWLFRSRLRRTCSRSR